MGNGYGAPAGDGVYDQLAAMLAEMNRRLREVETQRGTQLSDSVAQLRTLVNSFPAQLAALSASGQTWQGPVSSGAGSIQTGAGNISSMSGNITTGGTVTGTTGVSSTGVYNNLLTVAFRAQYITSTGPMGYVPSSRRFKSDETRAPDVREMVLALELINFRYNQEIERLGDDAAIEWGMIAEDVHSLGLTWLVDYDEDGQPFGIKYERLALALLPVVQDHEARLRAAGL